MKKILSPTLVKGKRRRRGGFTLIELLVCIAIFGILSLCIAQFLTNFLMMKFNAEMLQRIRQEGNYALDMVDYYIRNGVTLPNVCDDNDTELEPDDGIGGCDTGDPDGAEKSCNILFTNTQGSGTVFFVRNRVFLEGGVLRVFQGDGAARHSQNNTGSGDTFESHSTSINLTSNAAGSSGSIGFRVLVPPGRRLFSCQKHPFTGGYIVTTEFQIEYARDSLGSNMPVITETFRRETAVRNTLPFEN